MRKRIKNQGNIKIQNLEKRANSDANEKRKKMKIQRKLTLKKNWGLFSYL